MHSHSMHCKGSGAVLQSCGSTPRVATAATANLCPSTLSQYQQLLSRGSNGCPALFLAPMENLMDKSTRTSLLTTLDKHRLGTFDEACTGERSPCLA